MVTQEPYQKIDAASNAQFRPPGIPAGGGKNTASRKSIGKKIETRTLAVFNALNCPLPGRLLSGGRRVERHWQETANQFAFAGLEDPQPSVVAARHDLICPRPIRDGEDGPFVAFQGRQSFLVIDVV